MVRYRFITSSRHGKWYKSVRDAQCYASRIGAGFMTEHGAFIPYRGTILETCEDGVGNA